jgi:hypothetical protein
LKLGFVPVSHRVLRLRRCVCVCGGTQRNVTTNLEGFDAIEIRAKTVHAAVHTSP